MPSNSVTMLTKSHEVLAQNISAQNCYGHKRREVLFSSHFIGTKDGGAANVTSHTRATNDQQGVISSTDIATDIAIDGDGMLPVSDDPSGNITYTRRGDFRKDDHGYWQNGAGQILKAWKLDNNGKKTINESLLSNLENINFANVQGLPSKTSVVSIGMNLNSSQATLKTKDSENHFQVLNQGYNKLTNIHDILVPYQVGNKSLKLGDSFTFTSSEGQQNKTITYGAVSVGNKASNETPIFGAKSADSVFVFSTDSTDLNNKIYEGSKVKITVSNGESYVFTARKDLSYNNLSNNFNSIDSLATAINNTASLNHGLIARVVDNRIYVASKDASEGVSFSNVGDNYDMVGKFGFNNIEPAEAGEYRFNSLNSLHDAINNNQLGESLLSTIQCIDIKVNSLLPTSSLRFASGQVDGNKILEANFNPENNVLGGATVLIKASNNHLKAGDFVRIANMNNDKVPDGVYVVGNANANEFTINIVGQVENYTLDQEKLIPVNASWKIAAGKKEPIKTGNITNTIGNNIEITFNNHEYNNDDILYIKGGIFEQNIGGNNKIITLPAGYYTVTNSQENSLQITELNIEDGGNGASTNRLEFFRVGNDPGGLTGVFDTEIFTTTAESSLVSYNIGSDSHGYKVGNNIRFKNIGGAFSGIQLQENTDYVITGMQSGVIIFDAKQKATDGDSVKLSEQANIRVDQYARLFEYFGLDSTTDDNNTNEENFVFQSEIYDPTNSSKNLTGGNFSSSEVFSYPINVYNSLGSASTLLMHFAKLDTNKWAVELSSHPDENNDFPISNLITPDGLIHYGTISFNQDGVINSDHINGFDTEVPIHWNDGSETNFIKFDLENKLSDVKSGIISQVNAPNRVDMIQDNGKGAGVLSAIEVDKEGFIVGNFSNGEIRKLYQIPIAVFPNINGLTPGSNGTYDVNRDSGIAILKEAGVDGIASLIGGALELSNVDPTSELLKLQDLSHDSNRNARVIGIKNQIEQVIFNETKG